MNEMADPFKVSPLERLGQQSEGTSVKGNLPTARGRKEFLKASPHFFGGGSGSLTRGALLLAEEATVGTSGMGDEKGVDPHPNYSSSPASASLAASCSAFFLVLPRPRPMAVPSNRTSTE